MKDPRIEESARLLVELERTLLGEILAEVSGLRRVVAA